MCTPADWLECDHGCLVFDCNAARVTPGPYQLPQLLRPQSRRPGRPMREGQWILDVGAVPTLRMGLNSISSALLSGEYSGEIVQRQSTLTEPHRADVTNIRRFSKSVY